MKRMNNRVKASCLAVIPVVLMTLILLLPLYTASMDIYIPDTAEISDIATTEPEPQTEAPETEVKETNESEPDDRFTKKPETTERETFPSLVDYQREMLVPMAILLILAVSVFAASFFMKYHRK